MSDLILIPAESENLTEQISKMNIFELSPDLLNYKKFIWDDRPERWLPPLIEEKWRTPELDWVFDIEPDKKRFVPYFQEREKRFIEPHLTPKQYSLYLNNIEMDIPLEYDRIKTIVDEFEDIYDTSNHNWNKFMVSIDSNEFNLTKSIFGK
jgi:hypothetical protein